MAKFTLEIESRQIYFGPEERSVSELFEVNASVEYGDDWETDRDFDIEIVSDAYRQKETVAVDTAETTMANDKGAAISGTRTSAVKFTRGSGLWAGDLRGYRAWAENSAVAGSGAWYPIVLSDAYTITITGTLPAGCDTVYIQATPKIRHNLQVVPMPGFYGSFFKYKVTKKVPSDGNFKFFNIAANAVPTNLDPEFIAPTGDATNGWE